MSTKRGKARKGVVVRTASALDASQRLFVLPASAVATTKGGVRVAVVESGGRVRLTNVRLESDNVADVEISEGLSGSEEVIASPGPGVVDGPVVQALK